MRKLIALLLLWPALGHATPPRIIAAEETLLAHNSTHAFILRQINDNWGTHLTLQTQMVLISRDLLTGQDERQWPILGIRDEGSAYAQQGDVVNLGVDDRVNPFDILLWRKAGNLFPTPATWLAARQDVTADGLTLRDDDGLITHQVDWASANAATEASLRQSRAIMPIQNPWDNREGWEEVTAPDDLFAVPVDYGKDCDVAGLYWLPVYNETNADRILAEMRCSPDDRPLKIFVVIPPVEK